VNASAATCGCADRLWRGGSQERGEETNGFLLLTSSLL
jgi:hypothetical protein